MSYTRCSLAAIIRWAWVFALVASPAASLRADVFTLAHGGRLEGVWLDAEQHPVEQYEIQLPNGGRVILPAVAVKSVVREPAIQQQYQLKVAERGNRVADHWELAQWCRDHGLKEQRRHHLQRILRIEPDHADARRGLGHSFVRGRWITQDEFMREHGYVRYRGRWRLPQQVELFETRRKQDIAARQWYRQISQWRRDLNTEDARQGYDAIATIDDPFAVPALVLLLRNESVRGVRVLYLDALQNIGTPAAHHLLLSIALTDGDVEIMHICLDRLVEINSPSVRQQLMETLGHSKNATVNRAAVALERLGDDKAIKPLIDALVTIHLVPAYNELADEYQLFPTPHQNRDVLATLMNQAGISGFGFDKKAWKQWLVQRVKHDHAATAKDASVRRDRNRRLK